MILYRPELILKLKDYGIGVPLEDLRIEQTISNVRSHPKFNEMIYKGELESLDIEDYLAVHSKNYIDEIFSDQPFDALARSFELFDEEGKPHRFEPEEKSYDYTKLRDVILGHCEGSYTAMKLCLSHQLAYFLGGGMHHALDDTGHGFCTLNDIVIGVKKLQSEKLIKRAWIIDIDAHKGDGAAYLTQGDDSIVTMSVHMRDAWPMNAGIKKSLVPSDIDIEIYKDNHHDYLKLLEQGLESLKANYSPADIAIVVAGADVWEGDILPSSNEIQLTKVECLTRDKLVDNFLKSEKIPRTYLFAGGYGPKAYEIHTQFLKYLLDNS